MLYSKTTNGFYDPAIHGSNIPSDAVEITESEHATLMTNQASGATITADSNGKPVANTPDVTLKSSIAAKLASMAAHRYQIETGGVTIGGVQIDTDDRSKILLNSAYTSLKNGFCTSKQWKGENGWVMVTLEAIEPIAIAVDAFVQSCFNQEKIHEDAIKALTTISEVKAYDFTTGWPA